MHKMNINDLIVDVFFITNTKVPLQENKTYNTMSKSNILIHKYIGTIFTRQHCNIWGYKEKKPHKPKASKLYMTKIFTWFHIFITVFKRGCDKWKFTPFFHHFYWSITVNHLLATRATRMPMRYSYNDENKIIKIT